MDEFTFRFTQARKTVHTLTEVSWEIQQVSQNLNKIFTEIGEAWSDSASVRFLELGEQSKQNLHSMSQKISNLAEKTNQYTKEVYEMEQENLRQLEQKGGE